MKSKTSNKSAFARYIVDDLLQNLDDIKAKAMFGGYGLYQGDKMFGLIDDDVVYFKVDVASRGDYEAEGSEPFTYEVKGRKKPVVMSYWRVPESVLDSPELATEWAMKAIRVKKK